MSKTVKFVSLLITLVMTLECMGAAVATAHVDLTYELSIHSKVPKSSLFISEMERVEEEFNEDADESYRFTGIELSDLSQIQILLSTFFSPAASPFHYEERLATRPCLLALHCVFLI